MATGFSLMHAMGLAGGLVLGGVLGSAIGGQLASWSVQAAAACPDQPELELERRAIDVETVGLFVEIARERRSLFLAGGVVFPWPDGSDGEANATVVRSRLQAGCDAEGITVELVDCAEVPCMAIISKPVDKETGANPLTREMVMTLVVDHDAPSAALFKSVVDGELGVATVVFGWWFPKGCAGRVGLRIDNLNARFKAGK